MAEKLEYMRGRAVKVCEKAGIGRKAGHKKPVFAQFFDRAVSEKKTLDFSNSFLQNLAYHAEEIMFFKRLNGNLSAY